MMLDSSLGTKSKSKPSEPSLKASPIETQEKETVATTNNRSEAEVRLVFRFLVEEQIVYKGRIEKVKQLESEELSRLVSKIAWDEPETSDDKLSSNTDFPTGSIGGIPDGRKEFRKINSDAIKDVGCKAGTSFDTTKSTSCEKSIPNHQDVLCSSPIENVPHNSHETFAQEAGRERTASLLNLSKDPICDIHYTDLSTSPYSDTKDQLAPRIEMIRDSLGHSERFNFRAFNRASTYPESSQYEAVDKTIVETLNDCVKSVETNFMNHLTKNADESIRISQRINATEDDVESRPPQITVESAAHMKQHNITIHRSQDKSDKKPLTEAANVQVETSSRRVGPSTMHTNRCYVDLKVRSDRSICNEDDLNLMVPIKRPENLSPPRRRNTADNGSTNKRFRKSISSDGRKSADSECRDEKKALKRECSLKITTQQPVSSLSGTLSDAISAEHPNKLFSKSSKIFAKWTDNHFYPGTILKPSKDRKFTIGYFDGAQRNVSETDLIPLGNILGKQVRVSLAGDYCVNAIVHDKKSLPSDTAPLFDVEYQQDGLIRRCVPMKDLFLTAEQGATLINQPVRQDKNPDESMFAGLDLDNIVHVKRSRRLQELDEIDSQREPTPTHHANSSRRKRGNYNTRHTAVGSKSKISANGSDIQSIVGKSSKRIINDINPDTPISSCSPDGNNKANSEPPSEANSSVSTGSSNPSNALEMGQEFYFDSSSPHRTKTSLLL